MVSKAEIFELESVEELIRLVVANSQHRGGHIYVGNRDGEWYYFVNHLVPNWFELRGLPVTIFARSKKEPSGPFIAYEYVNLGGSGETWKFVSSVGENPQIAYVPIVRVKEIPEFIL
ncbi:MAG: hypothetical protein D6732_07735 [Methanobacteriota archaeon]|nr:MAG: hypothetical protein D6732_07735 [Euryarchaeota archaeon]